MVMGFIRLTISQLIAVSLGAVLVLMVVLAAVTTIELSAIGDANGVAEGRTQSLVKGQELAEALLRSVALSNAYALSETDGDLAAAKAANDQILEKFNAFSATTAGMALDSVKSGVDGYSTASAAMFTAIGARRSGADQFARFAVNSATTTGAITEAFVNDSRLEGMAAAIMLNDNIQAATTSVSRYLARRDPAQAEAAKYRLGRVQEALTALRAGAGGLPRIQRFIGVLEPQMVEFSKALDGLIAATLEVNKAIAQRQKAADALAAGIEGLRKDAVTQQAASMQAVSGSVIWSRILSGILSLLAVAVACLAWRLMVSRIVSALLRLRAEMEKVARGEFAIEISDQERSDEVGDMARALAIFRDNAGAIERMRSEQAAQEQRVAAEKRRAIEELAADFELQVNRVVGEVQSAASQMDNSSRQMANVVAQTARDVVAANNSAERALADVQTVSAATEELTASIGEIGRQIGHADQISKTAVSHAEQTSLTVANLSQAAEKIGAVVQIISEIAGQTNLLALNATIEAARAGDAGKGFAVVAGEVKHLASQTAKATDEIAAQVAAIQKATSEAVKAIEQIVRTITDISQTSTTVAVAVEQQQAATQEIARGVAAAADGTSAVATTLSGVRGSAESGGQSAATVVDQAGKLSRTSAELQTAVSGFLGRMRQ
jgi:methyl-accepting chemotaxis protein